MITILLAVFLIGAGTAALIFAVATLAGFVVGSLQCALWAVRRLTGRAAMPPWQHRRAATYNRVPVPAEVRAKVMARDGFACQYCGSDHDLTVDHIRPRIAGGTNAPENLLTACRRCNSQRGTHGYTTPHRRLRRKLIWLYRAERLAARNGHH